MTDKMPEKIWAKKDVTVAQWYKADEWYDFPYSKDATEYIRADLVPSVTDDAKREALHVSELPEDALQRIVTSVVAKENDPEYQALRESHDRLLEALDLARCLIKFHVKEGACVVYNDKQYSATDIFKTIIQAITEAEKLQGAK